MVDGAQVFARKSLLAVPFRVEFQESNRPRELKSRPVLFRTVAIESNGRIGRGAER